MCLKGPLLVPQIQMRLAHTKEGIHTPETSETNMRAPKPGRCQEEGWRVGSYWCLPRFRDLRGQRSASLKLVHKVIIHRLGWSPVCHRPQTCSHFGSRLPEGLGRISAKLAKDLLPEASNLTHARDDLQLGYLLKGMSPPDSVNGKAKASQMKGANPPNKTNKSPWKKKTTSFLVDTIKMLDFPWLYASLLECTIHFFSEK